MGVCSLGGRLLLMGPVVLQLTCKFQVTPIRTSKKRFLMEHASGFPRSRAVEEAQEHKGWGGRRSANQETSSVWEMTTKTTARLNTGTPRGNRSDGVRKPSAKGSAVGTGHSLRKLAISMGKQNRLLPHDIHYDKFRRRECMNVKFCSLARTLP